MKNERLTRGQIISAKEKLIIENFNRVSEQLGIQMNEINPRTQFSLYKSRVIERLVDLQTYYVNNGDKSAQSIIDAVQQGRYDKFITSNMNRGFTIDKTAMSIRDHWYGV